MLKTLFFGLVLSSQIVFSAEMNNVKIGGDFRFRNEQIKDEEISSNNERNRQRIRARLQFDFPVNSETDVVLRLATGTTDPDDSTSTNQDLTDYGAKKSFNLDMAYANWKPTETSQVWIGKSPVPYHRVGLSDIIFDTDLTSDGLSYKSSSGKYFWNAGYWLLDERHTASINKTDVMLLGLDAGLKQNFGSEWQLTLGAGYLDFSQLKNSTPAVVAGNSLVGGNYQYNFVLTRFFLELMTSVKDVPFSFFTELTENSGPKKLNRAHIVGFRWGELKVPKDWQISLDHREVQKDSVLGVLTESNSGSGGTDIRSYRMSFTVVASLNVDFKLSHMISEKAISVDAIDYNRTQFDLNFNF